MSILKIFNFGEKMKILKSIKDFNKLIDENGNLSLMFHSNVIKLPALKIKGDLDCYCCDNLIEIDPNIEVDGYILGINWKNIKNISNLKGKLLESYQEYLEKRIEDL